MAVEEQSVAMAGMCSDVKESAVGYGQEIMDMR